MLGRSLFPVLALAKWLALAGQEPNPWAWPAYLWQDFAVALLLVGIERIPRSRPVARGLYGIAVLGAVVNVPVTRALGAPLTWPMVNAAGGALADSMRRYVTSGNVASMAIVLAAALLLPGLLRRVRPGPLRRAAAGLALFLAVVGPFLSQRLDTRGLHRNVLVALAVTAVPRLHARAGAAPWRVSPLPASAPTPTAPELAAYRGAAAGKNVLLVVLESTGAQYLGAYGAAGPDPMPTLAALAARGLLVESAYAVYPESIKGLYSYLCSTYPAIDSDATQYRGYGPPSIAEALRGAGYRTALFHSGRFAYLGMEAVIRDRGFELLEDAGDIGGDKRSSFGVDDERVTVKRVLSWIDGRRGEKFFAAFLPVAGHHPYGSPPPWPFPNGDDLGRYRNALRHADTALAELLRGLAERGLDRETMVVVVGDHAEAFGQHPGNFAHSLFLYEENVRVPFVVAVPGREQPLRVARPASLLDLAPTILDVIGVPAPAGYQGASVLKDEERLALFFTDYSLALLGLRDGPWKFHWEVESRRGRLYDLRRDPGEKRDLAAGHPDRVSAYSARLLEWSAAQRHRLAHGKRGLAAGG